MHENQIVLAFVSSMIIAVYSIQRIILFANKNQLFDKPDERKIHKHKISNLGGVGVFMSAMFTYFAFSNFDFFPRPDTLFSISILLFFVGLKDDISPVKASRRLIYEVLCAGFIIYFTDIRIPSLFGILGIYELPYWGSCVLTIIFIVACINAYNMIDGIDGLLASLSILGVGLFGLMFLSGGEYIWTLLCASVSGALLGFLIYNWHPARIFMGNGGSMFIGTFFACACLRFMQMGVIDLSYFQQSMNVEIIMPHTIALSIISIPIFDMLTVFTIRVLNKQSPFKADKRHTHHRLLDIGLRQDITVIVLVLANILIILFAYYIQRTGALKSLIYTMLFCACLMFILLFTHWRFSSHRQKNKDL